MKTLPLLLAVIASAFPLTTAARSNTSHPAAQLSPRPNIENYHDYQKFIRDILAWQKQKRQLEDGKAVMPNTTGQTDQPRHWHDITGPENLDQALRNAYGYLQPNYTAEFRYGRTTHLSVPLERLPEDQMSRDAIGGGIEPKAKADREEARDHKRTLQPLPELENILKETENLQNVASSSGRPSPSTPGQPQIRVNTH